LISPTPICVSSTISLRWEPSALPKAISEIAGRRAVPGRPCRTVDADLERLRHDAVGSLLIDFQPKLLQPKPMVVTLSPERPRVASGI